MDQDEKDFDLGLAEILGDRKRDFILDPLSDEEITAIILTYQNEVNRPDLDTYIRSIYQECLKHLNNYKLSH